MTTHFNLKVFKQPYNLFLLTAVFLFIFSFTTWGQNLDFHLHDTYFVVSTIYFIWALAIVSILIWTIYKLTYKILWTHFMTWFHVLVTLFILAILFTINIWHDKLIPPIKRDFVSFDTFQQDQQREFKVLEPLAILFVLAQVAFVLNIFVGLIKKLSKSK